jgi:molecular chaperone DnaJ
LRGTVIVRVTPWAAWSRSICTAQARSSPAAGPRPAPRGAGEAGDPGAPRGDLVCEIHVKEHPLFHRDGDHLLCAVPISVSQAALGCDIDIPWLDGTPVRHTLRPGIQSGEHARIAGRGMPNVRTGRKGDLVLQVLVETPRSLTKRQEELYRELAEIEHKNVSPQRKSFFDKVRDLFTPAEKGDAPKGAATETHQENA